MFLDKFIIQNIPTKLFQKFIFNKDIRKFKNNFLYYLLFRLVRKFLNSKIEVKIYNFKILASNKKNIASHAILRKCDFTDNTEKKLIHQFLPLDINPLTKKFLEHWKPNISVF